MSNKPLHIRCRPKKLSEIVGNKHVVSCLQEMMKRKNKPKVYLLHGCYGSGKTTIAKIIAREVGCKNPIVINAGNDRGIDTAREIIEITKYKSLLGSSRFIIIDEGHQCTDAFQQSLLTTLEDVPDGVYFALCTTEPQKIIKTVRNRCVELSVSALSDNEMKQLITNVVGKENLDINKEAISAIVKNSNGIPRTALLMLEKIIGIKDLKAITEILSVSDDKLQKEVIDLCRALMFGKSWSEACIIVQSILETNINNLERVRLAILGYVSSVALKDRNINVRAMLVYECFKEPFYGNANKANFIFACLYVLKNVTK